MPTMAGYHFFAGIFGYLTACTESMVRFFNVLLGLASIFVVYSLSKELGHLHRKEKSLLTAFLPILFPFFFLIYTDVMSVLFVLLMVYFMLRQTYILSGLFGLMGFAVRQNNIVWVIFCLAYVIFDRDLKISWNRETIKKTLPYLFVLLMASLVFLKLGGFAVSGRENHPTFFLGPMNVYSILFFFFLINLPEQAINFRGIGNLFKKTSRNKAFALIVLAILFYGFFLLTFKIDHQWNSTQFDYYLRNRILNFFDSSFILQSLFFVTIAYSILSVSRIKLVDKRQYLIYPLTTIFLSLSWLIEVRYFIIPIVLINLFSVRDRRTEIFLISWYLVFTFIFMIFLYQNLNFW